MRRIGFILLEGYSLMSTAAAVDPLRAANLLAGEPLYELVFLSLGEPRPRSSVGASFEAMPLVDAGRDFEIVFVVAGGQPSGFRHAGLTGALRSLAAHGVGLGGISGGGVILAEIGLLQNRRFTVHWQHIEGLKSQSEAHLLERRLFVIDRDRYTCAGGSAPLDMMHSIIAGHHGAAFARRISDWFIHTEVRLADAPQRAGVAARYNLSSSAVVSAIELMESHLADPLSLAQLAELVDLSPRHLQRLFVEELKETAGAFYRGLRLEAAARLLRETPLALTEVAQATGFQNGSHFAASFSRTFGQSPKAYRRGR